MTMSNYTGGAAAERPAAADHEVDPPYAHSRNEAGRRQGLRQHLQSVAALAASNAAPFGSAELARVAGLWHDLGKYHPDFQRYLLECEAGQRQKGPGPDHKAAGASLASRLCDPLAFLIAGHHGGLIDRAQLLGKLRNWDEDSAPAEALRLAPEELMGPPVDGSIPSFVQSPRDAEFYIRMLFSALVDADYLDTEEHFQAQRADRRQTSTSLQDLWRRFEQHHRSLRTRDDVVSQVRRDVYSACLQAAELSPGMFRLTVPTGGGKTLSSMAFALRHALLHGLRRVIVAVPYTSITEQTAGVYRAAFGHERAVLEHHSALDPAAVDEQTIDGLWARLAAENWDAPIVVTTTVQLFESLFARSTSKCRKLHRLAGSVIVLDEAQALPTHLLATILDGLRALVASYRVTVVLCSATQPALDDAPGFKGLAGVREIAPDPPRLFAGLRRVDYELPQEGEVWSWQRAAEEMRTRPQALAITNTIADALALFQALDDQEGFCLSTLLCGAHRRRILNDVRHRLGSGQLCRVVSTQVVEAGVDIDFPLVLRAVGPLDRIVQAAGRCNREGRLTTGRVVVFRPAEGGMPPGPYKSGADLSAAILSGPDADLHDPALYTRYFRELFNLLELDTEKIQELRTSMRYEEVANRFRMIKDDMTEVVVPYDDTASRLLDGVRSGVKVSRYLFRALQSYMVSVRSSQLKKYQQRGLVEEVKPGLLTWLGEYDDRRGLVDENRVLFV